MDSAVVKGDEVPLDLELLLEVEFKLFVDVLNDGSAAVLFVDLITKALCAHDHQPKTNVALLQLYGEGGMERERGRQNKGKKV